MTFLRRGQDKRSRCLRHGDSRGFSRLAKTGVGRGPKYTVGRRHGAEIRHRAGETVFPLPAENIMNGLTGGAA